MRMTAFGEKIKIFPTAAHRLSDQLLAVVITFGGVDHIEAGIERAVEQRSNSVFRRTLISDLRSSKSEDRDGHVGLSKAALFHQQSSRFVVAAFVSNAEPGK